MLQEAKTETPVNALSARLGVDREALEKIARIEEDLDLYASGEMTIKIPVSKGRGLWNSAKFPSFWVTVTGSVEIKAPSNGTWYVKAEDTVAGKVVFAGNLKPNEIQSLSYKTGFTTQIRVTVAWSEQADTTLEVLVKYNF